MHVFLALTFLFAGDAYFRSAEAKLDALENNKVKRGSVVVFSLQELNSWARYKVPEIVPQGIRDQRVTLGTDSGTAFALMDFLKMRHAEGKPTSWVMSKLIEGERPVTVSIRVHSGGGFAIVDLSRVEISGATASGTVLDFLIKTFFLPLYPSAKIGERFEIGFGIDRIDISPSGIRVTMQK
jgi:hypothetical protein